CARHRARPRGHARTAGACAVRACRRARRRAARRRARRTRDRRRASGRAAGPRQRGRGAGGRRPSRRGRGSWGHSLVIGYGCRCHLVARMARMTPVRRVTQLLLGLLAYALSMAMLLHAGQGGMPWDVLHQGVVRRTGLPFGVVVGSLSVLALLAWIPLRQRLGVGTVANVVVITLT